MSVFNSMRISASGLSLERLKMDIISTNVANVNTTRTEEGGPYRRKEVIFEESLLEARRNRNNPLNNTSHGVRVVEIVEDEENVKFVYDPDHPDADANGYLETSNVNMVDEMIALLNTQRAYEANVTVLNSSKSILNKALEISKD